MADNIIKLADAQAKVRAICLNGTNNLVSLMRNAVSSYAEDCWDNLSDPAANFLRRCIDCLEVQKDILSAQKAIKNILQHFGDVLY